MWDFAFDFNRLTHCGRRIGPNIQCGEISKEEDANNFHSSTVLGEFVIEILFFQMVRK